MTQAGRTVRTIALELVVGVAVLFVTGCGSPGIPVGSPAPTAPSTVDSPSIPATLTPSPSPSDTPLSSGEATPSESSTSTPTSPGSPSSATQSPRPDPSSGSDRPLTKADFFNVPEDWGEDRWQIPRVGEVTGLGAEVRDCEEAKVLEFRADGAYKNLSFKAAPGSSTQDSDQRIVVGVYNNDDFIDRINVPYGKVGQLAKVNIDGVSALKFQVSLDSERCDGKSMFAVLYDVTVN